MEEDLWDAIADLRRDEANAKQARNEQHVADAMVRFIARDVLKANHVCYNLLERFQIYNGPCRLSSCYLCGETPTFVDVTDYTSPIFKLMEGSRAKGT